MVLFPAQSTIAPTKSADGWQTLRELTSWVAFPYVRFCFMLPSRSGNGEGHILDL